MGERILDVRNFSVDYGWGEKAVRAVDDVDVHIDRSKVLGIAGESGSGKSTLVYAITRLLRAPGVIKGGEARFNLGPTKRASDVIDLVQASERTAQRPVVQHLHRPAKRAQRAQSRRARRLAVRAGPQDPPARHVEARTTSALRGVDGDGRIERGSPRSLSTRTLRRATSAHHDRARSGARPSTRHHGRAHDGARRRHATRDHQRALRTSFTLRIRDDLHHARPLTA
jgi:ABC-type glutathione transport system ATPase component